MRKTLTTCPYCGTGCSFYLLTDENEKLVGVERAKNHVVAKGQLCIKGWNAFHFVNHPQRLTTPLIRKKGQWVPVSWEEALDFVVRKLHEIQKQYGSDSLMFLSSAKTTNEENYLMMKLARAVFGTNNVDHCARLCHSSTVTGLMQSFGSGAMTNSISCMEQADCIFVIGSNTTEQHPLIGTRIIRNKFENKAKLIVADNRKIRLARIADIHLRHKNGTDVPLLNAMMHVIIRDGLENKAFIKSRTENYEALKKMVAKYTPESVSKICGVDAKDIELTAKTFAKAKRAMIVYSMGITQHTHGVDNVKSCANLALLTGHIGRPGTGVNPLRGQNNVQGACDMGALPDVYCGYQRVTDPQAQEKFEKAWQTKLSHQVGLTVTSAMDAAAKGKVKAMFIMGENPMMSDPDQKHIQKALKNLDLLIVQDIFMTETGELADVILPGASYAEKNGTFTSTERRVQRVRKAIDPVGLAQPDWQILCDIAKRAGYANMQYESPSEIMEEIAKLTPIYGGIHYDRIEQTGLQWPCTSPDHPGTSILHTEKFSRGLGQFTPAEYLPSVELPDEKYPFILSTGRCYFHFHTGTMTRKSRLLDREEPHPYVEMNATDAKKLSIRDQEWIEVSTRRGKIKIMTRITDISEGVIFIPFHFKEAAANLLTINARDPIADIPEFKVCAAKIEKMRPLQNSELGMLMRQK